MANSKLDKDQKITLKYYKKDLAKAGGFLFSFPEIGATVAVLPMGKTMRVSMSIMSDDEEEFRTKVGAYHALVRILDDGAFLIMNCPRGDNLYSNMECLADMAVNG